MTGEHDALRDLIAPVALGAADPEEIARVEAHAAECPVCAEELMSLRASADVLAVAVPQHVPGPELKASLMATVRAEAAARRAAAEPAPAPAAVPPRRGLLGRLGLGGVRPAIAVLGAVVALFLGWGIATQLTDDPSRADEVTTLAVAGTADAPGIEGRVVYVPDEDTAVVELNNLPVIGEDEAYQLWVLREGAPPRSAGLFTPTGPAQARTVATGLRGAQGLAVTAQPRTSRTTPEGPILVQAALA